MLHKLAGFLPGRWPTEANYLYRKPPDAGAGNYVYLKPVQYPVQTLGGPGVLAGQFDAFAPYQLRANLAVTPAFVGGSGVVAGDYRLSGLVSPSELYNAAK